MLRSAFYCVNLIPDNTMKRRMFQYKKKNGYKLFDPYYFIILLTNPTGKDFSSDIINEFKDIFNIFKKDSKISANRIHNRFIFVFDTVLIDDNKAKVIRYTFYKRMIKSSIVQIIPIDKFTDGYVYIGYNVDECKIYTTYDNAYSDIYHNNTLCAILKVSTKHMSSDYAFCSADNRDRQKDNEYYYDIEETLDRNNPTEYYDYCMRLVAGEITYYRKDSSIYSYWLELCCAKSYDDFLNPKYVEDMMSIPYPIEWDKDYYYEEE